MQPEDCNGGRSAAEMKSPALDERTQEINLLIKSKFMEKEGGC